MGHMIDDYEAPSATGVRILRHHTAHICSLNKDKSKWKSAAGGGNTSGYRFAECTASTTHSKIRRLSGLAQQHVYGMVNRQGSQHSADQHMQCLLAPHPM